MKDQVTAALKEYLDYLYDRFELYKQHQTLKTYYLGKIDCAREVLEIVGNVTIDSIKNKPLK